MSGSLSSSQTSSKRGKSKNGSDKPKQPRRGLGVAELEKIRLNSESNCNSTFNNTNHSSYYQGDVNIRELGGYPSIPSSPTYFPFSPSFAHYGFHPNMMMNASNDQYERPTIRYGDSHSHIAPSTWNSNYGVLERQHFVEPKITRHFLHEEPRNKSMGSCNQNFEMNDENELDLELRL